MWANCSGETVCQHKMTLALNGEKEEERVKEEGETESNFSGFQFTVMSVRDPCSITKDIIVD